MTSEELEMLADALEAQALREETAAKVLKRLVHTEWVVHPSGARAYPIDMILLTREDQTLVLAQGDDGRGRLVLASWSLNGAEWPEDTGVSAESIHGDFALVGAWDLGPRDTAHLFGQS